MDWPPTQSNFSSCMTTCLFLLHPSLLVFHNLIAQKPFPQTSGATGPKFSFPSHKPNLMGNVVLMQSLWAPYESKARWELAVNHTLYSLHLSTQQCCDVLSINTPERKSRTLNISDRIFHMQTKSLIFKNK